MAYDVVHATWCMLHACTPQLLRDKSDVPSNFCLKLRKHIRTKRLEEVRVVWV